MVSNICKNTNLTRICYMCRMYARFWILLMNSVPYLHKSIQMSQLQHPVSRIGVGSSWSRLQQLFSPAISAELRGFSWYLDKMGSFVTLGCKCFCGSWHVSSGGRFRRGGGRSCSAGVCRNRIRSKLLLALSLRWTTRSLIGPDCGNARGIFLSHREGS